MTLDSIVLTFVVVSWGLFGLFDKEEQEDAEVGIAVGIAVDKIDLFVFAVDIDFHKVIGKDLIDIVDKKVGN